jgi:hypothetical protein
LVLISSLAGGDDTTSFFKRVFERTGKIQALQELVPNHLSLGSKASAQPPFKTDFRANVHFQIFESLGLPRPFRRDFGRVRVARQRGALARQVSGDRCYDFSNNFAKNAKNSQTTASFLKKFDHNIG